MKTKLTLRLDENVIDEAKAFAESQGTSLSKLVEGYFKTLTTSSESPSISPFILSLTGILPAGASEEEYGEHLEKEASMIVCVDTNIWLDVLQNRPAFVRNSSQALSLLEEDDHSVLVCATTITTIHYLFSKYTTKTQSRTVIQKMLDRYNVAQVDRDVLRAALLLDSDDYEDAVLYVAGLRAGADAVLTRDRDGFSNSTLPVLTPVELVQMLS